MKANDQVNRSQKYSANTKHTNLVKSIKLNKTE